ncbi:hypothetical protein C2869_17915 [Saccharobesus litoralis]|uniref:Lipoprotein n=1 Tax=Saccharobesus litoralis TaxID=2172099 RepID=A0A2S0VVF4_9ALTE|nr:hypothetical protein [Saccharobesus litoralis]AWB68175.1 hypothetical protein C2869_17915 [Saccharobesus litoralis]
MTKIIKHLLAVTALVALLPACSTLAPQYAPQVENVNSLKESATKDLKTGDFTIQKKQNSISLRGTSLKSPNEDSYAVYLQKAITSELNKAKLLNPLSPRVITANIVENDLDATGFSEGEGEMEVAFKIEEHGKVIFNKNIKAKITWPSSFIGAVAIPNAQQSYPKLVKQLLANLYVDQDFVKALKN